MSGRLETGPGRRENVEGRRCKEIVCFRSGLNDRPIRGQLQARVPLFRAATRVLRWISIRCIESTAATNAVLEWKSQKDHEPFRQSTSLSLAQLIAGYYQSLPGRAYQPAILDAVT